MGKILIIAEAGVNHNGSLDIAKRLAWTAKECGADIVKFQTAKLSSLVSRYAEMADYQKENIGRETSQREMLRKLLLSYEDFEELSSYCKEIGIQFLSTPFDIESIDFLESLGCGVWKIPSGEITNLPYLERVGRTGQDIILSTGMSTMSEIEDALQVLRRSGSGDIVILHCTTEYPAPYDEVNLKAMRTLAETFRCRVGYSDHTEGIEVAVAAAALGAEVIEKHFTLDKTMEGPDHKASLEPAELRRMVQAIRNIEKAMGSGIKEPTEAELGNRRAARKSIVAKREIRKGELLSEENVTTKRPGNGISPMEWRRVLGTSAIRDFKEDELIEI